MDIKMLRTVMMVLLIAMLGVACNYKGGSVRPGGYYPHRDFYYRNPWHDFDRYRRPIIIAPPPVIEPPPDMGIDPDFGVDPGLELMPML